MSYSDISWLPDGHWGDVTCLKMKKMQQKLGGLPK